jgi:hypothetical protein
MVDGPEGKSEVSLDGDAAPQPAGPGRLGMGKQLTIGEMMAQRGGGGGGTAKPGQRDQLRPETAADLDRLHQQQNDQAEQAQAGEPQQESAAPESPQQDGTQEPELEPAPRTDESLLYGTSKNPYDDPKVKEAIEKRCDDLSFNSLLTNREIQQVVPIRPTEWEVTFRSHTEGEEKYVRTLLFGEGREGTSADMFYTQQADYLLVLNLVSINGNALPNHRNNDGLIDEEAFKKKLKVIESYPVHILGFLAMNNTWFEERLRKLVTEANIKNG